MAHRCRGLRVTTALRHGEDSSSFSSFIFQRRGHRFHFYFALLMTTLGTISVAESRKRISKEHRVLQNEPLETCSAKPSSDENLHHWTGTITGPPNTPYAGGVFHLDITFPENYPRAGWQVTMTTPIFHPNVSEQGETRLAELDERQWCPAFTIQTLLISLQAMLSDPNPLDECVVNLEAAGLYVEDRELFEQTARHWTDAFARLGESGGG